MRRAGKGRRETRARPPAPHISSFGCARAHPSSLHPRAAPPPCHSSLSSLTPRSNASTTIPFTSHPQAAGEALAASPQTDDGVATLGALPASLADAVLLQSKDEVGGRALKGAAQLPRERDGWLEGREAAFLFP